MTPSHAFLVRFVLLASFGFGQAPPMYEAPRVDSGILVDGILDDHAWTLAPWTSDFIDILGADGPTPHFTTRAKLAWSDDHLLVGAEMEEPHLWATLTDRDAIIYRDDDFEVFLDPSGSATHYFEIEVNALGTVLDLFLARPYNKGGSADLAFDVKGLEIAVTLHGTLNDPSDRDGGWTVEMAIPWESLTPPSSPVQPPPFPFGSPPAPGDIWRVNFSRVEWPLDIVDGAYQKRAEPTPENRHPEWNWVWAPQGVVNMHVPERWGVVRFVDHRQLSPAR